MINENSVLEKPSVELIFKNIKSGIGLDVAKNHTGIVIWNGKSLETYGFELDDYDKDDCFAEYRMRREFKIKLGEIVRGRHFDYAVIEDVYGGENFDTVRKLIALNTVIDELIFDRVCTVDNFTRWKESQWAKWLRTIYKPSGNLKSKLETQAILEYLGWDFYLEHKDDKSVMKKAIFFEDICDACGMLLGLVANKFSSTVTVDQKPVKISDIKMYYISDMESMYLINDSIVDDAITEPVDLDYRNLEKSIIAQVSVKPNDVLCAFLPSDKLGVFGMKHKFKFYDSDEGFLVFYKKHKKGE